MLPPSADHISQNVDLINIQPTLQQGDFTFYSKRAKVSNWQTTDENKQCLAIQKTVLLC